MLLVECRNKSKTQRETLDYLSVDYLSVVSATTTVCGVYHTVLGCVSD